MGVNFGGFNAGVPHHDLDVADVAAIFQKLGGKGVTEQMATATFAYAGLVDAKIF